MIERVTFYRCGLCEMPHFEDSPLYVFHTMFAGRKEALEFEELDAGQIAAAVREQAERRRKRA